MSEKYSSSETRGRDGRAVHTHDQPLPTASPSVQGSTPTSEGPDLVALTALVDALRSGLSTTTCDAGNLARSDESAETSAGGLPARLAAFKVLSQADAIPAQLAECNFIAACAVLDSIRKPVTVHLPLKAAVDLLALSAAALPALVPRAMSACVTALSLAGPRKNVARRLRHVIRTLLDAHGNVAAAAFVSSRESTRATNDTVLLREWDRQAASRLSSLPLTPEEWLSALTNYTSSPYHCRRDDVHGVEEWLAPSKLKSGSPTKMVAWNANSFFKRLRTGDFAELVGAHSPDVIQVSELKGPPHRTENRALRAALYALGYAQVCWNFCVGSPSNHGSAVFSKHRMETAYGTTTDGVTDEEGRTITTHFADFSVVWSYSPCTAMSGPLEPKEAKRRSYDRDLTNHIVRVQQDKGADRVLAAGDYNVAPLAQSAVLPPWLQDDCPSCRPYEREAHMRLRARCGLDSAARHFLDRPPMTWRHHGRRSNHSMELDHLLAPASAFSPNGAEGDLRVVNFQVSQPYGSDHRALLWEMEGHGRSVTAACSIEPALPPTPPTRPSARRDKAYWLQAYRGALHKARPSCKRVHGCRLLFRAPTPAPQLHPEPPDNMPSKASVVRTAIARIESDSRRKYLQSRRVREDWIPLAALPSTIDTTALFSELGSMIFSHGVPAPHLSALPVYTIADEDPLPHSAGRTMPESDLPMCKDTSSTPQSTRTLWDTGATYNIMTQAHAEALGLRIESGCRLPTMQLADKSLVKPVGRVHALVNFGGVDLFTMFYVMKASPYPAILGWHFATTMNIHFDAAAKTATLQIDGGTTTVPIGEVLAPSPFGSVSVLHAKGTVTVPPRTEMNIPVRFAMSRRELQERWGVVADAGVAGVTIAAGFTCALQNTRAHYHVRVLNASSRPVCIAADLPMATFTPVDGHLTEAFHVMDGADFAQSSVDDPPCAASAMPVDEKVVDAALAAEWVRRPHLQDLDLSHARKTLDATLYRKLQRLILDHHELWDTRPKEPPPEAHVCDFDVEPQARWTAKTRPMAPPMRDQLRTITREQLAKRIIEPSKSPFSSAVVLVPKKGGGMRFAIDYRSLNAAIQSDAYTLPKVDESLSSLHGAQFFSSLDMKEAFWSVPLAEHCKQFTAFQTPDGLMQYHRMAMGLKTASAVFSRYVDHMLGEMKFANVLAYIDDLLVFAKSADDHIGILEKLFAQLSRFNMTLGAKKCTLFAPSVGFLGHVVDRRGVRTDPAKVASIEQLSLDGIKCKKDMESALGLMSYYRKFISRYSAVEKPLRLKLQHPEQWRLKDGLVCYSEAERTAFYTLRDALVREPILAHPDWAAPFELHCDASYSGIGAVLTQRVDGKERVISYASRGLAGAEANYSVWELECLAIVWASRLFRMYLTGSKFKVITDSAAAAHVIGPKAGDSSGRLMRWALALQEFWPFSVEHRAGRRHGNADGLSRLTHAIAASDTTASTPEATVIEPATILGMFGADDATAATSAEFRALQQTDSWCQRQQQRAVGADTATAGDIYVRGDGLLMKKAPTSTAQPGVDRVLVPSRLKAFLLRRYHGLPISGHLGWRRTLRHIATAYFWDGMSKDVRRWVQSCLACRRRKTPRNLHAGVPGAVSVATRPWQTVAIDVVSASTKSAEGYTKILTVMDLFSRYVMAIPLKRARAKEVGGALFSNLFCRFGKPERIHSDEGREFVNKALHSVFDRWGIAHSSTGGHQPQANPVERYHRFMNSTMTMLSTKFGGDWPEYLPAATFAYNASTNDATGYKPHEIIYGVRPRLLQDLPVSEWMDPPRTANIREHHMGIGERLQAAYKAVREQQERIAASNRQAIIDRRGPRQAKLPKYETGDHVLYWEPRQPKTLAIEDDGDILMQAAPQKWKDRWSGPHKVTKVTPDRTGHRYTFYHRERGLDIETHVNKLCRFQPWSEGIVSTSQDLDNPRLYRSGEWVKVGELIVIPLLEPCPFGIAKVLSCTEDGDLTLQWYCNAQENIKGTYLPGWLTPARRNVYYAEAPREATHQPYTTAEEDFTMNQRDVLIHSFRLTKGNRVPAPLLRAIARHPLVWWKPQLPEDPSEVGSPTP